jgi:hypothetical protein
MIYDPNNPLTEEELDKLGEEDFDSFLEYLDGKAAHLKKFARPLNSHETKKFASATAAMNGKQLTDEEFERIKEIGKENERKTLNK